MILCKKNCGQASVECKYKRIPLPCSAFRRLCHSDTSIEYMFERTPRGVQTEVPYICANNSRCRTFLVLLVILFVSLIIDTSTYSRVGAIFAANDSLPPARIALCSNNHGDFSSHASAWLSRIIRSEGAWQLGRRALFLNIIRLS